jgi:hypothetical protein
MPVQVYGGFGRDAGLVAPARDAVVSEVEDEVPADSPQCLR